MDTGPRTSKAQGHDDMLGINEGWKGIDETNGVLDDTGRCCTCLLPTVCGGSERQAEAVEVTDRCAPVCNPRVRRRCSHAGCNKDGGFGARWVGGGGNLEAKVVERAGKVCEEAGGLVPVSWWDNDVAVISIPDVST